MAYFFSLYRDYELELKGELSPKYKGIKSAPCEFRLRILEIVVDFCIIVVIMLNFITIGKTQFNDVPLLNYFILIDIVIMLLSLPYSFIVQVVMVNGEITKNIFTLF